MPIFSKIKDQLGWIRVTAAILLWMAAIAYTIQFYLTDWNLAWMDSAVLTLIAVLGMLIVENVFGFFVPKKNQFWVVFVLPILLAWGLCYLANIVFFLLIEENKMLLSYLEVSFVLRVAFCAFLFFFWSWLVILHSKLEDQNQAKAIQERVEQMRKEAELYHLKQQLQPHFLFNSLNSVNALVKSRPDEAREMLILLAEFLRATIKKDDQKWVSVEEEKGILDLFLSIEKVRFGHRLSVNFWVEEAASDLFLPQLMVQPLLENAVKHGLYGVTGDVLIQVKFEVIPSYLQVKISNTYDKEAGNPEGVGFGLEAVKRRLYLMFGRNDLLTIEKENDFFNLTLKIPQYHDQDNNH
jgi:two-component system, LytTR family, sensor kinase